MGTKKVVEVKEGLKKVTLLIYDATVVAFEKVQALKDALTGESDKILLEVTEVNGKKGIDTNGLPKNCKILSVWSFGNSSRGGSCTSLAQSVFRTVNRGRFITVWDNGNNLGFVGRTQNEETNEKILAAVKGAEESVTESGTPRISLHVAVESDEESLT